MCGIANADVYVVTNQQNNVYSLSSQNDAVVPSGYTLTVMSGKNIQDLPIVGSPQLYNFSNGSFTLNTAAVQAQNQAQVDAANIKAQMAQDKASAIAKLTDAINKVATQDVLTQQELEALLPSS